MRSSKAVLALTIASIKMYFRNFTAVFFTFIFPIIFLVVFGFISSSGSITLDVAYFNNSETELASEFDAVFRDAVIDGNLSEEENEGRIFRIDTEVESEEIAREKLADGDLNATIIVPENFGQNGEFGPVGQVEVLIDESNVAFGEVTGNVINGILNDFNVRASVALTGQQPITPFSVTTAGVQSDDLDDIDYLVPGIIAFSILSLGVFSITEGFIQLKTDGSLRRLHVTPIKPISFLIAQSLTRLLMTVINVLTMLAIGIFMFGFNLNGDIFNFMLFSVFGIILFLGFGYAIAGWARDSNQAAPISNIIFFPMMFLSGTFFPRESFPDWLQPITDYIPLTYVANGLRDIANNGTTILGLGPELLGVGVWTVVIYFIAIKLFRWE